jgi:hypothetical protein
MCPECSNSKHVNCTGWALDESTDQMTNCACPDEAHPWNRSKA